MTELPRALTTRIAYENAWMRVREDLVRWPGGHEAIYGVVEKPDFAVVLPRDREGWWMVEQYRYTIGRRAWEFPQGSWPAGHGGDTRELAAAELREETGFEAASLEHLGRLQDAYGFTSQGCDLFLATGLTPGEPEREPTEHGMVHRWVADEELDRMIRAGEVVDAVTIAALTLVRLHRG